MTSRKFTRRSFLGATVAASGAMMFPVNAALAAPEQKAVWSPAQTANGWPVLAAGTTFRVEGSSQSVSLADGDSATVLLYVARRFSYEIGTLRDGEITGHSADRAIPQPYESNYLSGTAIAIRPALYPAGAKGLFYPNELAVIRDILARLGGAVVWGGDEDAPKESHFQIAYAPGHPAIKNAAQNIREWDTTPGGAGAGVISAFTQE
jgi:hypothetical protein